MRRGALTLLAIASLAACARQTDETESARAGIADRTFVYAYESGVEIKGRFEGETRIHWEGLKGPAAGSTGSAPISAVETAPGVWFVSWVESGSDFTVSQVLNLDNKTVTSFVTWPTPDGRQSNLDRGALTETTEPSP